jgi:hypothetical protein
MFVKFSFDFCWFVDARLIYLDLCWIVWRFFGFSLNFPLMFEWSLLVCWCSFDLCGCSSDCLDVLWVFANSTAERLLPPASFSTGQTIKWLFVVGPHLFVAAFCEVVSLSEGGAAKRGCGPTTNSHLMVWPVEKEAGGSNLSAVLLAKTQRTSKQSDEHPHKSNEHQQTNKDHSNIKGKFNENPKNLQTIQHKSR